MAEAPSQSAAVLAGSAAEPLVRRVMPELDSVRGLAILLVVFYHGFGDQYGVHGLAGVARWFVGLTMTGWTGVYLFFVLSGFLITGILVDSKPKPRYYQRFYIRRALRILPAYYLLLMMLAVLPRVGWVDRHVSWGFLGLSAIYLSNLTTLFGVRMNYGPLWSLAVEEHFYLGWPTLVKHLSRRGVAWTAFGIFVASPLIRAASAAMGWGAGESWTWLVADGLALGSLMGVLVRGRLSERGAMARFAALCAAVAALLVLAGLPFGILHSATLAGRSLQYTVLNLIFAALLAVVLLVGTSRFRGWVQWPVLRFYGEISYGLYLIHTLVWDVLDRACASWWPYLTVDVQGHIVPMTMRFMLGAGLATGIAWISRRTFEEWFLSWKDRLA